MKKIILLSDIEKEDLFKATACHLPLRIGEGTFNLFPDEQDGISLRGGAHL